MAVAASYHQPPVVVATKPTHPPSPLFLPSHPLQWPWLPPSWPLMLVQLLSQPMLPQQPPKTPLGNANGRTSRESISTQAVVVCSWLGVYLRQGGRCTTATLKTEPCNGLTCPHASPSPATFSWKRWTSSVMLGMLIKSPINTPTRAAIGSLRCPLCS